MLVGDAGCLLEAPARRVDEAQAAESGIVVASAKLALGYVDGSRLPPPRSAAKPSASMNPIAMPCAAKPASFSPDRISIGVPQALLHDEVWAVGGLAHRGGRNRAQACDAEDIGDGAKAP